MRVNHLQYIFNFVEYDSLICQKTEQKVDSLTSLGTIHLKYGTTQLLT